jgi:ankyrin repeat protein
MPTSLQSRLKNNPRVVLKRDRHGNTLVHRAAAHSSPEYCRVLLEFDHTHESLPIGVTDGELQLPIHVACKHCNLETARYLLELHPGSINMTTTDGWNCLHWFLVRHVGVNPANIDGANRTVEQVVDFVRFLLKHAPGLISSATPGGELPLHVACRMAWSHGFSVVTFLCYAYPAVFCTKDNDGDTPLAVLIKNLEPNNEAHYL